jgi:broad specificity phosphatase PhoE
MAVPKSDACFMTVIYLIRHGQASFGAEDYDKLSALGHRQSSKLGDYLREKSDSFSTIIRGSLVRHEETLNAALPDAKVTVNADWNEFDHKAIIRYAMKTNGLSKTDLSAMDDRAIMNLFGQGLQAWLASKDECNDFPESWAAFQARVHRAFQHCIEQSDGPIAVFTSGGPISTVLGKLWNLPPEGILKLNWSLANASVSKIVVGKRGANVASYNEHHHLEKESHSLITYK